MIEVLKQTNLVDILSHHWGVEFTREGRRYRACSPFRDEKKPSFYVTQQDDGHWVFYDHGSGEKGSLIDAVMAYEGHQDLKQAIDRATEMVQQMGLLVTDKPLKSSAKPESSKGKTSSRNLEGLLQKLSKNPIKPARDYLIGRGIAPYIIDNLIDRGVVLLNKVQKSDYCGFAIYDTDGNLKALFNRKISGPSKRDKFTLGQQFPFCQDWGKMGKAPRITMCESIIDALSFQTMNPHGCALAVPGVNYDVRKLPELPEHAKLIDAFDGDQAGCSASMRLKQAFPDIEISRLDLRGEKDVNALLNSGTWVEGSENLVANPVSSKEVASDQELRQGNKLSLDDRVAIALSEKTSRELAEQYGVHHSRICHIRNDATHILKEVWSKRRPGRKSKAKDSKEVEELRTTLKEVQEERDLKTIRQEWLELQIMQKERRLVEMTKKAKAREAKKKRQKRSKK